MRSRRLLLTCTIGIGLFLHLAALFGLHNFPLNSSSHSFHHCLAMEQATTDYLERQRRCEILAEIFEHVQEVEPEVKKQFHELQAEYAPSLEIVIGKNSPREIEIEPFVFEPDIIPASSSEGELALQEGSRLMTQEPLTTTIATPPLAEIEYEDDLYPSFGSIAGSEHFDIDVEYAPKRNRPGYVFKVTFHPRSDIVFKRIRQNVFFLIDRSNSIPRARYALNKRAVAEALDHLKPGDTFNILIFDDHVVRFAPEVVPWNQESMTAARAFLEHQGHGGYFAATELYASLGKIIPQDVSDHEVNTAILLSDGDTYLPQEKQRQMIGRWTHWNQGKVTLYCVATGTGNNLPLLSLISAFNKGRLIYSQDHNDLFPMLINLIESVHTPIGKEMIATSIPRDKQTTVLLQPKAVQLPDLYQDHPFVVYGSTNRLSDFVLFLQGKYYDRRFDIKKKISFERAKIGSFSIERNWTELLAHEFYARYFEDGNLGHLEAAKQLLIPMKIPTPWMD